MTKVVNESFRVIVDRVTQLALLIPCKETWDASNFAEVFLQHAFAFLGLPLDIVSDRGSIFVSKFTKSLYTLAGIRQRLSTAYHPQTNGQTERVNQILEQYLRTYCNYQQDDWVELLPLASFAYNNAEQATTKTTPFYASYGYHPVADCNPASSQSPAANDRIAFSTNFGGLHKWSVRTGRS